ncbi:nitroreductase family protein [Caldovatus aquaticus]|uniref:Nitroreductase family protein n=1 Tax=Caldovatus aquaticus TaxID=2865671 RepID=A0ABS7EZL8_9PROT|nr:nitroreductase family protein [Caldovatus aquaticus]MBW8268835.1 nitroreductase family protein [Caldovatus aquaticus]
MSATAAAAAAETLADLLSARYGAVDPPPPGPDNAVIRTLLRHRSVRSFLPDRPLPPGALETLIAAASSASTSSNLQAWSVVAVEEPERKARLSVLAANQKFIRDAPLFLVWIADLSRLERLGRAWGKEMEGLPYLESFVLALVDAALAAQNAVVAAESLGLGCVYVGAIRNRPAEVAAELRLPPNAMAAFGLAVGWPDPLVRTEIKPRLPQRVVLHRETYGAPAESEDIARYDAALAEFSRRNGLGDSAWTPRVLERIGTLAGLAGRHRLREVLIAMGFGLR